jgi:predicted ferric reductase
MTKNQLGNYVIAGFVAFHVILWLVFRPPAAGFAVIGGALPPYPYQSFPQPDLEMFAEMLSSTGVLLMACGLILSNKPRALERYFGGLDKMYTTHKTVAIIAVLLIIVHELVVPKAGLNGPGIWFAWLAFFCIIVVVLITLGPRVPLLSGFLTGFSYSGWRKIHRYMGVFFIFAFLHMMMVQPMILLSPVLAGWILFVWAVGIGAYLYKQFLWKRLRPHAEFTVEQVNKLNGTTLEIRMKAKGGGKLDYRAGQFTFVYFDGDPLFTEPHPFTISSAPAQDEVILSIKASGDWTQHLHVALKPGAAAYLDGPYGMLNYKTGVQQQLWIAGGIGVTPFMSWIRDFSGEGQHQIDFFYAVSHPGEAIFVDEILLGAARNPHFKPHITASSQDGRLTLPKIVETTGPVKGKDVYLCGPIVMILAFREALRKQGVPAANIHYEEFNFR